MTPRRRLAASAMAWFANRKASRQTGSASSAIPRSMRSAASRARCSSSSPVPRRFAGLAGTFAAWRPSHCRYSVTSGVSLALASAPSWRRARASMESSTPAMEAGATRSTSASGIQQVRTRLQAPSTTTAAVATLWPTANSPASRYCRSATRSSQSSLARLRRSGLGRNWPFTSI